MRNKTWYVITPLLVVASAFGGYLIGSGKTDALRPLVVRANSNEYKFINPLFIFGSGQKDNFPEYKPLGTMMNEYIDKAKTEGKADSVSIYFRDFTKEMWTGVNEDEKYAPASMLKVTIMLSYLKQAESDPGLLSRKVFYTPETDDGQYFKPKVNLPSGYYSNETLIKNMIEQSDNASAQILITNQQDAFRKVNADLGLPTQQNSDDIDFMSARIYSRLFRVLYNATYLSKTSSEKALDLLSNTSFNAGLIDGLPATTTISHKFGERTVLDKNTNQPTELELHDCGIVYKPGSPYFVCIMTRGKNFTDLESVISGLSDLVYKQAGTL